LVATHKNKYSGSSHHVSKSGKVFGFSQSRQQWIEDILTPKASLMPIDEYEKLAQTSINLG